MHTGSRNTQSLPGAGLARAAKGQFLDLDFGSLEGSPGQNRAYVSNTYALSREPQKERNFTALQAVLPSKSRPLKFVGDLAGILPPNLPKDPSTRCPNAP